MTSSNPYQPPQVASSDPYVSLHWWRGREIAVRGGNWASALYLLTGYTITIDGSEQFTSAQLRLYENFRWQFAHEGRMVEGHFETFDAANGFVRKYRLSIDGEQLGPSSVHLSNAWAVILWPAVVLILSGIVFAYSLIYW